MTDGLTISRRVMRFGKAEMLAIRRKADHNLGPMKLILLSLTLFSILPLCGVARAGTLAELSASSGTGWMIGKWATQDGGATLTYAWKLDKNVIGTSFTMGDRASEGMIVRKPGSEDAVVYGAADNKGGVTTGKWIEFNGQPTLVAKTIKSDGTERSYAVGHGKSGEDRMIVKLYSVGDDGQPDASQSREVIFERQK